MNGVYLLNLSASDVRAVAAHAVDVLIKRKTKQQQQRQQRFIIGFGLRAALLTPAAAHNKHTGLLARLHLHQTLHFPLKSRRRVPAAAGNTADDCRVTSPIYMYSFLVCDFKKLFN